MFIYICAFPTRRFFFYSKVKESNEKYKVVEVIPAISKKNIILKV